MSDLIAPLPAALNIPAATLEVIPKSPVYISDHPFHNVDRLSSDIILKLDPGISHKSCDSLRDDRVAFDASTCGGSSSGCAGAGIVDLDKTNGSSDGTSLSIALPSECVLEASGPDCGRLPCVDALNGEIFPGRFDVDFQSVGGGNPDSSTHGWKEIAVVTQPRDENRMTVVVSMGSNEQLLALVDSGASISLIHMSLVNRYRIPIVPVEIQSIRGFGFNNVCSIVGECELTLEMHNLLMKPTKFLVIEGPVMGDYPVLLATNFLIANRLVIDMARKRITQKLETGGTWEYYVHSPGEHCTVLFNQIPCYSASNTVIRPGQSKQVAVSWTLVRDAVRPCDSHCPLEYSSLVMFDELSGGNEELQAFPGVFSCASDSTNIIITNNGSVPERVMEGEMVGTITSLLDASLLERGLEGQIATATAATVTPLTGSEIVIPDHLSSSEKMQVMSLLNRRSDIFSRGDDEVGCLGVGHHRIELCDYTPIYQRPRRFPEVVNQEIEKQCRELELMDIIEPSSSPWSSPIVPVRKKDGTIRLCIDYRKLNSVTKPDRFPLPNLNDAVFGLQGMRYFTTMDLIRGYYQLPLDESSREFTAFSTPRAHWQFKRLSFGLKNAPSAFQREMQSILSQFPWRKVIVYIDDVLIMSETFEEHIELVEKVISTLSSYGVKVKITKCKWFEDKVEFLGHIVSKDGLAKPHHYLEKVDTFPRPETVRELRTFLGLVNFQRKFVPDCSTLMKPLSKLTGGKRSSKLIWSDEMDHAFNSLKAEMRRDITLSFPDYGPDAEPLELYSDASNIGVGACLVQCQGGVVKPIAFNSMTFSGAQFNYSVLEKELAAIRWAVKSFRPFLFGVDFIVRTDHQPLVYLNNMQIVNSRLARTLQDLSDFSFVIRYTPGRRNTAADAMSRIPLAPVPSSAGNTPSGLPVGLFLLETVPGGGESMITSLLVIGQHVTLSRAVPSTGRELRQAVVDELLRAPDLYHLKMTRSLRRDLQLMKNSEQLLCVEVMLAFGHLYDCVVFVHYGGQIPVVFEPHSCDGSDHRVRVHLQCVSGIHYNPVIETEAYKAPRLPTNVQHSAPTSQPHVREDLEDSVVNVDVGMMTEPIPVDRWCTLHTPTHASSIVARVGGITCCVLLDTGAQLSCVSRHVQLQLPNPIDTTLEYHIRGIGPGRTKIFGSVDLEIEMSSGRFIRNRFAVVPDCVMPFCLIIGADCLINNSIRIDFDEYYCHGTCGPNQLNTLCLSPDNQAPSVMIGVITEDFPSRALPETVERLHVGTPECSIAFSLDCGDSDSEPRLTSLVAAEELLRLQKSDRQLVSLRKQLRVGSHNNWPINIRKYHRYDRFLQLRNDLVVINRPGHKVVPVVSFSVLVETALVFHHQLGHPGRQKLISVIDENVWHPSLASVAADVSRTCISCQKMKVSATVQPPITKITTSSPFELVAADLIALPRTHRRSVGCLMVIDHNSKWLCSVPIASKEASTVSRAMKCNVLPCLPKVPTKLLTDNGPEFKSANFNDLLAGFGIKHLYTTPYKAASGGLVERVNRTVSELLRSLESSPNSWDDDLSRAVMLYNSTYHSELKMSPAQYLLTKAHDICNKPLLPTDTAGYWREGNPSFVPFRRGQRVLRKKVFKGRLLVDKLGERFQGPFEVIKTNDNKVTYLIKDCTTQQVVRAHHTQLRRYYDVPRYIASHPYYVTLKSGGIPVDDNDSVAVDDSDDDSDSVPVSYMLGSIASSTTSGSEASEHYSASSSENEVHETVLSGMISIPDFFDFSDCSYGMSLRIKRKILQIESESADLFGGSLVGNLSGEEGAAKTLSSNVDALVQSWSVSDMSESNSSLDDNPADLPFSVLETSIQCMDTSVSVIIDALSVAEVSSVTSDSDNLQLAASSEQTSFFSRVDTGGIVTLQDRLRVAHSDMRGKRAADLRTVRERFLALEEELDRVRSSIADHRRCARLDRQFETRRIPLEVDISRPRTRSMGSVPVYPTVMSGPLEYRRPS